MPSPKCCIKFSWFFSASTNASFSVNSYFSPQYILCTLRFLHSSYSRTYSFLCAGLSILLDHNLQRNRNHISFFLYGPKELYINVLNLCTTQQVNAHTIVNVSERVFGGIFKWHFRIILKFQLQKKSKPELIFRNYMILERLKIFEFIFDNKFFL